MALITSDCGCPRYSRPAAEAVRDIHGAQPVGGHDSARHLAAHTADYVLQNEEKRAAYLAKMEEVGGSD